MTGIGPQYTQNDFSDAALHCASEALNLVGVKHGIIHLSKRPHNIYVDGGCWVHIVDNHYEVSWAHGTNCPKRSFEIADPNCFSELAQFINQQLWITTIKEIARFFMFVMVGMVVFAPFIFLVLKSLGWI
jgi:hypothetical protein